jgi:hypothetical protein
MRKHISVREEILHHWSETRHCEELGEKIQSFSEVDP